MSLTFPLLVLVGCSDPQKQAVKSLEKMGYEATTRDLIVAAGAGDFESLVFFQDAGLEIDSTDQNGNTALIKASSAGQLATVERILGMGADPRHVNVAGRDALLAASAMGYDEVARMLMSRGADAELKDKEGWSALSIAAYNGHSDVVSLLSAQATPNALDDALLVASFSGDAEVIDTLLGQGANINARSPEGKTSLMISADGGKDEAVRTLLQNRANPYAKDNQGKTAANLAELAGHTAVRDLILSPDRWGTSATGMEIAEEMTEAREALMEEASVEETLMEEANVGETVTGDASQQLVEASLDTEESVEASANASASANEASTPTTVAKVAPQKKSSDTGPSASEIRKNAKSKPVVALNGSTIHSTSPAIAPVKSMVLASYHEEPLPIAVENVNGNRAEIRRLDQETESFEVAPGSLIPGTPYEVKEVTKKFVSSKEGKGRMVDVSRVKVENRENGATHLLVQDVSGQASDTYAILTSANSQYRYVVKRGDVFRTSQPDQGVRDYQVLDIRAEGVVVKDLATEDVVTIARDGVVAQ
ncbi:MAG: ankyrin repeat domain-containing protein [Verrucomicrobiales bacterium]|nr:ankyrin repeat domain-containing protein [Verrucomicrobiales bacterium]